jgi:hypothetical protein
MTDDMIAPLRTAGEGSDATLLREQIGFVASSGFNDCRAGEVPLATMRCARSADGHAGDRPGIA